MSPRTRHVIALAGLVVVLLSGCTVVSDGGTGDTSANATAIADRVERTLADTDTLRATLTATTVTGNTTLTEHLTLRYQRPQHYNLTWLDVTNESGEPLPNATGDAMIANGSQLWAYDEATDKVSWLNATRPRTLSELLMPSTQFGRNVTFLGNETVAGEDAIKLSYAIDGSKLSLVAGESQRRSRIGGRMNESTPVNATVWIDRDQWLPIKTRLTISAFEDDVTITYRYEDLRRNVDIADSQFDLPADATRATPWQRLEDRVGEHQSVAAVAREASAPVTAPTVPVGYGFEWGNVTTVDGTERVILFYGKGVTKLQVTRWDNASLDPVTSGETVPIGSVDGTYVSLAQSQLVEWHCGGYTYLVSTRAGREAALATARSVGC